MIPDGPVADTPENPRVLVLASTFRTEQTGSHPGFINELCRHLQTDNDITVLTQHNPGQSFSEEIEKIAVRRYRYAPDRFELLSASGGIANTIKTRPLSALLVPALLIAQTVAIWRLLKRDRPDIIHAHWIIPQGLCAVAARSLSRHKPRIILTSHGGDLYGLKGALFRALKRFIIRKVDHFCVVSQSMKSYTREELGLSNLKINVCPMGADLDTLFTPPADDYRRNKGQLLFVGRLVEKKGVRHLLEAMPEVVKSHPTISLVIAGAGPLRTELEQLAGRLEIIDKVSFLGSVPHEDLPDLYRACDVAVFPFVRAKDGDMEGLGLVVVEAMGCGAPVLVGDVPAVFDMVKKGETGLIGDPLNRMTFGQAISTLLSNVDQRREYSRAARIYACQNYSWPVSAKRYHHLFDTALS